MEQVQEQADVAEDSTPQAVEDSQSAQAQSAADPVETIASETRAQSDAEAVDPDKVVFERLTAGEKAIDVRQNPKPADPSPTPSDQEQNAAAKSKAPATDAYEGSDPKGIDALRRAQLLPPGDVWASMPASTQKALIASAKNLLKQKGQISQQIGQRATLADDTNDSLDAEGVEDDSAQDPSGTAGHPPQAAPTQPRGARAQTQPAARPEAQPGLDDAFKGLIEFAGEDAVKPLRELIARQQETFAQQHRVTQAEYQQALQKQATVIDGIAKVYFMPQEREAFKTLESEAGKMDAPTRAKILRNATLFFQASLSDSNPLDWQQSIEMAGRSILQPDIKQQAQAALIDRRKQALRATPSRGSGETRPTRALAIEDRDKAAMDMLRAGRDAKDVRAALA